MLEAQKGIFSLINYKIVKFSLEEPQGDHTGLSALFEPSGVYSKSKNTFVLNFNFAATYGDNVKVEFISATIEANFKFDDEVKSTGIPNYFYTNSIAIIFPYLRAFITTLTAVANIKPLILPLLNLQFLEGELREKTKFID